MIMIAQINEVGINGWILVNSGYFVKLMDCTLAWKKKLSMLSCKAT